MSEEIVFQYMLNKVEAGRLSNNGLENIEGNLGFQVRETVINIRRLYQMVSERRTKGRNGLRVLRQVSLWWFGKISTIGRRRVRHL